MPSHIWTLAVLFYLIKRGISECGIEDQAASGKFA
jgi:hypothetical protein